MYPSPRLNLTRTKDVIETVYVIQIHKNTQVSLTRAYASNVRLHTPEHKNIQRSRVVLARVLERARARAPPRMSRARAVVDDDVFDSLDSLARRELASAIASRCADASRAVRAHERATVAATVACATHAARARAVMRECSTTMRDVAREWRWMTSEETIRALEGALAEARAFRELAERFERACDEAVARSGKGVG